MKVRSIQQPTVSPNNNQIERTYSTSIANIAKNLSRVALPIIAFAAFASVLSVVSFNYDSCIAACNDTARLETRYNNCMRLCRLHLPYSVSGCWDLCNGPLFNKEISIQEGRIYLKP